MERKRRTNNEILRENALIRGRIDKMDSVDEMFWWKNLKNENFSVESVNRDYIGKLGWSNPDVLYSFLGIYVIGIFAYYPEKYIRTDYMIKNIKRENMYSLDKLTGIYHECIELNENTILKAFIKKYFSIGNIMPTWPGANCDRGKSYVYDIPDIYYKQNELWTKILTNIYKNSFLDDVLNPNIMFEENNRYINDPAYFKFDTTPNFLNDLVNDKYPKEVRVWLYSKWLERIVGIINSRELSLKAWMKKNNS